MLKLAVPWNEAYLDTTKLGKCLSGACGGCPAHLVLPVLYALANPLPDGTAAACAVGEGLQDLASHSASSQVVSPWENHVGSPALHGVRAWAVCPCDLLSCGMCTSRHLLGGGWWGAVAGPAGPPCLAPVGCACATEVWQTALSARQAPADGFWVVLPLCDPWQNCLPEHIEEGGGWSFGALLLIFGYTGHEGQINRKEDNLYALLARSGCGFLPACFPMVKEPKLYSEVYDSFALLLGERCYGLPWLKLVKVIFLGEGLED